MTSEECPRSNKRRKEPRNAIKPLQNFPPINSTGSYISDSKFVGDYVVREETVRYYHSVEIIDSNVGRAIHGSSYIISDENGIYYELAASAVKKT